MATPPVSKVTGTVRYDTNTTQLATVDVYDSTSAERQTPQNLIIKTVDDVTSNLLKTVLGQNKIASLTGSLVDLAKVAIVDSDGLKKRIKDLGADYKVAINNASKFVAGNILTNMGASDQVKNLVNVAIDGKNPINKDQIKKNLKDSVTITINGSAYKLSDFDYDKAASLKDTVTPLVGNASISSSIAKNAIAWEGIKAAQSLKIGGVANDIIATMSPEEKKAFLTDTLLDAIKLGSVEFLSQAITGLGKTAVLKVAPDLFKTMLRNYSPYIKDSPLVAVNVLFDLFNQLDPNWYKVQRFGVSAINYDLFNECDPTFIAAIKKHPDYQRLLIPVPALNHDTAYQKLYA